MRIHIVLMGVILALSLPLWSAHKAQPFNIKPGLWQTTVVTASGELALPAEMLNRLTPEQRARLEERRKADSGKTHTRRYKRCLTRQQLANPDFTLDRQCTWTTLAASSTRIKGNASCNYRDSGMKLTGSGKFAALDREHVKGSVEMIATGRGRSMDTINNFTSRWLGPSCGGVK
jgi:hypothetical protein